MPSAIPSTSSRSAARSHGGSGLTVPVLAFFCLCLSATGCGAVTDIMNEALPGSASAAKPPRADADPVTKQVYWVERAVENVEKGKNGALDSATLELDKLKALDPSYDVTPYQERLDAVRLKGEARSKEAGASAAGKREANQAKDDAKLDATCKSWVDQATKEVTEVGKLEPNDAASAKVAAKEWEQLRTADSYRHCHSSCA